MTHTRFLATGALLLVALLNGTTIRSAEAQAISLAEAISRAEAQSELVGIARAGTTRAEGEEISARSLFLPQIFGSAGYTKTLRSQFEAFQSSGPAPDPNEPPAPPGPCGQYLRDTGASTVDERLAGVEQAARCSLGASAFGDFGDLPFGQENQWSLGLQFSQALYSGGRLSAGYDVARAGRRTADIELASQRAQLTVQVTEAYYDAALAERLVTIADSALAQTELALRQTELARQVGDKSEFDLLRARVTRDNQRPLVITARSQREIAYFRLKQLVGIPFESAVQLTTAIQDENLTVGALPAGADTSAMTRSSVRQAIEGANVSEGLLRIQRAERMPAVSLTSSYGRVGYPRGVFPGWNDFLDNWTVGVGLQVPLFTGGRLKGSERVARANLEESQLRVRQMAELAALDARATIASLREAEEAWRSSIGTVEQAQKANDIAQVRFREGLSTQLELTESRVLMQQAQANRAIAARNLLVIRARLSVISDLPLGAGAAQMGDPAIQQARQQLQQQLQQGSQPTVPAAGGMGGTGGTGGTGGGEDQ